MVLTLLVAIAIFFSIEKIKCHDSSFRWIARASGTMALVDGPDFTRKVYCPFVLFLFFFLFHFCRRSRTLVIRTHDRRAETTLWLGLASFALASMFVCVCVLTGLNGCSIAYTCPLHTNRDFATFFLHRCWQPHGALLLFDGIFRWQRFAVRFQCWGLSFFPSSWVSIDGFRIHGIGTWFSEILLDPSSLWWSVHRSDCYRVSIDHLQSWCTWFSLVQRGASLFWNPLWLSVHRSILSLRSRLLPDFWLFTKLMYFIFPFDNAVRVFWNFSSNWIVRGVEWCYQVFSLGFGFGDCVSGVEWVCSVVWCRCFVFFCLSAGVARVVINRKGIFTRERQPKAAARLLRRRYTRVWFEYRASVFHLRPRLHIARPGGSCPWTRVSANTHAKKNHSNNSNNNNSSSSSSSSSSSNSNNRPTNKLHLFRRKRETRTNWFDGIGIPGIPSILLPTLNWNVECIFQQ